MEQIGKLLVSELGRTSFPGKLKVELRKILREISQAYLK
jgi:hypothetical protein